MKKILLLFLFISLALTSNAIKYRELGSQSKFSIYTFDSIKYLMLAFEDDKYHQISDYTILKFKLKNDKIIRLENTQAGERQKSKATSLIAGMTSISNSNCHYVMFEITDEIMEMMQAGIKAVVINTIPEIYFYNGDETENFGELLFKDFSNLKNEFNE